MLGKLTAMLAEQGQKQLAAQGLNHLALPGMRDDMCPSCACRAGTVPNGCLQRIATATELAARNHAALVEERDRLKLWLDNTRKREDQLARRCSALRGVITRMKKAQESRP